MSYDFGKDPARPVAALDREQELVEMHRWIAQNGVKRWEFVESPEQQQKTIALYNRNSARAKKARHKRIRGRSNS